MDCNLCNYATFSLEDYPCSACKNTAVIDSEEYNARPDMFEPATNPELEAENDVINHPKHYETGKFECIDVMTEAIGLEDTKGFCLCNAFKYKYRCCKKNKTPVEDVKKAIWYLNKFLELEGEPNDTV